MENFSFDARVLVSLEVDAVGEGLAAASLPPLLGRTPYSVSASAAPAALAPALHRVHRIFPENMEPINTKSLVEPLPDTLSIGGRSHYT